MPPDSAARRALLLSIVATTGAGLACGAPAPAPVAPVELPTAVADAAAPTALPSPSAAAPPPAAPSGDALAVDAGVCSDPCRGAATPELQGALQKRGMRARLCYNRALVANRGLQGRIKVGVRVAEDGTVCETRIIESTMPADMTDCAASLFRDGTYPPPRGGCIEATIPLSFVAQPADAGSHAGP